MNETRQEIIYGLLNIYSKGLPLRASNIQEEDNHIYHLIYRSKSSVPKGFNSISEAREALADHLREQGKHEDANEVLAYNKPQQAHNKLTQEQLERRRQELIDRLNQKIEDGEDVSLRFQQSVDRSFTKKANMAFGTYRHMFEYAGLDYSQYSRFERRDKAYYLNRLISYIEAGEELDGVSMKEKDPELVKKLNDHYGGYYDSLRAAREKLANQNNTKLMKRADPEYWKKLVNERRKQETKEKKAQSLEEIIELDTRETYTDFEFDPYGGEKSGKEILDTLKSSDEWLTTSKLSQMLDITPDNIRKNLIYNFSERIIKFKEGSRHKYLFHHSIVEEYRKINTSNERPNSSIQDVAFNLNTSYTKIRDWANLFNLGTFKGRHRELSEVDQKLMAELIEREKRIRDKLMGKVEPGEVYTIKELDIMGIPTTNLETRIREGELSPEEKDGIRAVRGETVLEYLNNNPPLRAHSHHLRLITHFVDHLYTNSDLTQLLGEERSKIRYRIDKIREFNPDSILKIRKSEKKSKDLVPEQTIPCLETGNPYGIILFNILKGYDFSSANMAEVINDARDMIDEQTFKISPYEQIELFKLYNEIKNYRQDPIEEGSVISRKDLTLVYRYMTLRDYKTLETSKRFTIDELGSIIAADPFIKECDELSHKLRFTLYNSNLPLIHTIMNDKKVDPEEYENCAKESLLKAIDGFDPYKGFKFSTYAGRGIRRAIERHRRKMERNVSLNEKIGDDEDKEMMDLISYSQQGESEVDINLVLKELNELPKIKQEIIRRRFGLENKYEKLEEISKSLGYTRERVRQLQNEALKELASKLT